MINLSLLLESLLEDSEASKKAKQMGLDYYKFGRYGKDGKVTHTVDDNGKLVPVPSKDDEFGKPKVRNIKTIIGTRGKYTNKPIARYDPKTDKVKSLTARTPDQQRRQSKDYNPSNDQGNYLLQKQTQFDRGSKTKTNKYDTIAQPYIDRVHDAHDTGKVEYDTPYTADEFMQVTGLKPIQFKFMAKYGELNKSKVPFWYNQEKDQVYLNRMMDDWW